MRCRLSGPRRRGYLGLPEDLVGQQVPHAGDPGLVEQPGLDRDRPLGDQAAELRRGDLGGVRAERVDVGVQPDAPEPALVEQHEAAAVGEPEREPVPFGLARLRVAAPGPAALGGLAVRDVTTIRPPMPRWMPRSGPASNRPSGGLAPHRLAPPVRRGEHPPGQRGAQLAGGVRPAHERVAVVHVHDAAVQRLVGDQAAGGLDLGKFGHLFVFTVPGIGSISAEQDPADQVLSPARPSPVG